VHKGQMAQCVDNDRLLGRQGEVWQRDAWVGLMRNTVFDLCYLEVLEPELGWSVPRLGKSLGWGGRTANLLLFRAA
jgi:hypothetical protein